MENITRVILGIALLLALRLGFSMAAGKSGRGNLTSLRGLTIMRSLLVALIGPLLTWYVIAPQTLVCRMTLTDEIKYAGLVIFMIGMSFRIWSQKVLGDQWSADLSTRSEHRLVDCGPYQWFRHPIYDSYYLMAPGLTLSTENWLIGSLAFLYLVVTILRIPEEEKMLLKVLGDKYAKFMERRR